MNSHSRNDLHLQKLYLDQYKESYQYKGFPIYTYSTLTVKMGDIYLRIFSANEQTPKELNR